MRSGCKDASHTGCPGGSPRGHAHQDLPTPVSPGPHLATGRARGHLTQLLIRPWGRLGVVGGNSPWGPLTAVAADVDPLKASAF